MDELRRAVSDHCLSAAERDRGIFSLSVPTGGGKTLASLRFALGHAARHKMDRIVFVIPFTSIIDQNAEEICKILEQDGTVPGDIVLEHHSNLTPERQTWRNKILSENWDAPVVFTTSVQLLETLFGAGTRGARRMHQLANSVIVFDEIQTLPVRTVHLFNNAMNFLVESCRSSIVLCTATQPLLGKVDEVKGALHLGTEIVPDVQYLFDELSRVNVLDERKPGGWTDEQVSELAIQEQRESGSCLVVVNTKKAAGVIYRLCKDSDASARVFHLSTSMCPSHRKAVLSKIRELLLTGKSPVLCVSTQLIEAGVDVDFGSVIRFMAGLDSIAQAAGRCNRHGRRPKGRVHVVNPVEDPADMIPDIRIGKEIAERVLSEITRLDPAGAKRDVLSPKAIELYFKYYFFERRKEMSYPVKAGTNGIERDDSLLNMLSENTMAVASAAQVPANYLRQSFKSAAEAFRVIDAPTQGVIVPHMDGTEVIAGLCAAFHLETEFELLKRAQQFTVNVFPHVLRRLQQQNALHEVQEGSGILYIDSRKVRNTIEFKTWGRYAMFTDPLTRVGGEKCSYHVPTYEALKGVAKSIYWKPTFIWIIDAVRIMKRIRTQTKGTKPLKYGGGGHDLSIYTFLTGDPDLSGTPSVEYQVRAHFEWNDFHPELKQDQNEHKHFQIAQRMLERGGRQDIFLGTRDCQGYVEPCEFGSGMGAYDEYGDLAFGVMFHGFDYPDETGESQLATRFWRPTMSNGVIRFVRPEECPIRKVIHAMTAKTFGIGENLLDVNSEVEKIGGLI